MMFHPAVCLLLWVASVVVLQSLSGDPLRISAVALALLALASAPARSRRLVKRARWLLLAMIVVFAWATPGRLCWPEADWVSPTVEGIKLAVDHGARLLGLLMLVALLLEHMTPASLLGGLYSLLRPLQMCGLDRSRAALRLGLVLRYADQPLPREQWREWLRGADCTSADVAVRLDLRRPRIADLAVVVLAGLVCALAWFAA